MSSLRPRDAPSPRDRDSFDAKKYQQRAPDADILLHNRKRAIEVKCLELQDRLEEEAEVDEEEIEKRVQKLREQLLEEMERGSREVDRSKLKPHMVHEIAAAKMGEQAIVPGPMREESLTVL